MSGAKSKRLSPFDFLKTINDTKINLIDMDESNAKSYNGLT